MSIKEIRDLYHSKVIPKQARSEIKRDFMSLFGYANPYQFTMKMKVGSMEIPTPKEFEWLSETIVRYYDYYQAPVQLEPL